MTTTDEFIAWHEAQLALLQKEREAEIQETSLLFSNCSASLLEKQGLALLSLGVSNISLGLGGKRLAACPLYLTLSYSMALNLLVLLSSKGLERIIRVLCFRLICFDLVISLLLPNTALDL